MLGAFHFPQPVSELLFFIKIYARVYEFAFELTLFQRRMYIMHKRMFHSTDSPHMSHSARLAHTAAIAAVDNSAQHRRLGHLTDDNPAAVSATVQA